MFIAVPVDVRSRLMSLHVSRERHLMIRWPPLTYRWSQGGDVASYDSRRPAKVEGVGESTQLMRFQATDYIWDKSSPA
ncbi:hypothetical protein GWI33_018636 [Rhynchophorus ferrugineus]|uniref:Uncharacterized protein n=1 Tax=Rhynchophorus ferrugineus TaxID=354439 RepID=A0A834HVW3_RHYFE|nr:hypothetical protein GWI33_018636 [Rhynchophorus ferrugineus]